MPDDYPFLKSLSARVFGRYSTVPVATLRASVSSPDAEVIVADARGESAGFAIVDFHTPDRPHEIFGDAPVAYLSAIAVRPDLHRRGLGLALLEECEAVARERSAIAMWLNTAVDNTSARALFERSGYLVALSIDRYYARGQRALAMFKSLR